MPDRRPISQARLDATSCDTGEGARLLNGRAAQPDVGAEARKRRLTFSLSHFPETQQYPERDYGSRIHCLRIHDWHKHTDSRVPSLQQVCCRDLPGRHSGRPLGAQTSTIRGTTRIQEHRQTTVALHERMLTTSKTKNRPLNYSLPLVISYYHPHRRCPLASSKAPLHRSSLIC